jgi:hypothetical protein
MLSFAGSIPSDGLQLLLKNKIRNKYNLILTVMRICPLCTTKSLVGFKEVKGPDARVYNLCENCHFIFTTTRFLQTKTGEERRPNTTKQQKEYDLFLNGTIKPALEFLKPGMSGLDYGCGAEPKIPGLLEQEGLTCDQYDPVFFPELDQDKRYDFIFATECFERSFLPAKELQKIKGLLKEDGILVIMTELWQNQEKFKSWNYAKDPAHVSFFHQRTFNFIAEKTGMNAVFSDNSRVVIFQKAMVLAVA